MKFVTLNVPHSDQMNVGHDLENVSSSRISNCKNIEHRINLFLSQIRKLDQILKSNHTNGTKYTKIFIQKTHP